MQHASLTGSGTTGRTRHDGYLFGGEFFLFHFDRMQKYRARNSSILHTISISPSSYRRTASFPYITAIEFSRARQHSGGNYLRGLSLCTG